MTFFFIIGVLIGITLAVSITMLIMVTIVKKSNDWGDSNGLSNTIDSFAILNSADNVKESFSVYDKN